MARYAALCLVILGFAACERMTPVQYNDTMAHITDSLYQKGVQWGTMFGAITSNDQYSKLAAPTQDLLNFIAASRDRVRGMKPVGKEPEPLRKAMLDFLNFEERLIKDGFTPVTKINASSTEEQITAAVNNLVETATLEGAALQKLQDAQTTYAGKNGFVIKPNPRQ